MSSQQECKKETKKRHNKIGERGVATLVWTKVKITSTNTQMKCIERGDKDDTSYIDNFYRIDSLFFIVLSLIKGKRPFWTDDTVIMINFSLIFYRFQMPYQYPQEFGPSYLAWKREEHRTQKPRPILLYTYIVRPYLNLIKFV